MSENQSTEVKVEDQVTGQVAEVQPEQEQEQGQEQQVEDERVFEIKPITIRLPSPTYPQTLPKLPSDSSSSTPSTTTGKPKSQTQTPPSTFIIHPQPTETIQDIRAALLEWTGGYWLGPYSLRIPAASKKNAGVEDQELNGVGRGRLLGKGKEGVEVREGEKLSDWFEIGEVFGHLEGKDDERVLVVQREPYSEADARQAVLRLREYTMPPSESTPTFGTIGINPGPSVFEGIQSGALGAVEVGAGDVKPQQQVQQTQKPTKSSGNKPQKIKPEGETEDGLFAEWKGLPKTDLTKLPLSMPAVPHPACFKSLIFSPFNPPPPHLRQRGHLVYLTVVTLEGEAHMVVCHTKGWYVARSNAPSVSFDPAPRTSPKAISAHSLIDLLHALSPGFTSTLRGLQGQASNPALAREPIATVPIPQYPPAYPWLATAPSLSAINPDLVKTQLAYGYTGAITPDALEGARDWNEELQNARELPKSNTQERVLRERVLQKTHAEFTAACIRGSMAIARGDLPPINPHEEEKAHMWLANNIFFTKGVNSVDAYTHLGGDEAARISHAKDAAGVRLMNKMDLDNVYLLGHTVVDWQGERWVCQSVLPGIFSRRVQDEEEVVEPTKTDAAATDASAADKEKEDWVDVNGHSREASKSGIEVDAAPASEQENYLIIYGADSEGGIDKLHWDAGMHRVMGKIAAVQKLALHKMKDSKGDEYEYWTSVDVKGLRGSDGRRYLLDLPRLSPVDIEFLEKDMDGKLLASDEAKADEGVQYPHRVVLLRPELLETFWEHELKWLARKIHAEKQQEKTDADAAAAAAAGETKKDGEETVAAGEKSETTEEDSKVTIDAASISKDPRFDLRFNADAFVDQPPKTDAEGKSTPVPSSQTDESEPSVKAVRDASIFLRTVVVPSVVLEVIANNTIGVMDGASLSKHLHAKGINIRYLGYLMKHIDRYVLTSEGEGVGHLKAILSIVQQEMVFRACKHIIRRLVHGLQAENSANAVSHFLNCLLGVDKNAEPTAVYDSLDFQDGAAPAYTRLTPASVKTQIIDEIAKRFRWNLEESYFTEDMRKPQLLRELATRIAFQLDQREYDFTSSDEDLAGSQVVDGAVKSKKAAKKSKASAASARVTTFEPTDILTLLPVVKSAAPSAGVAEEVFEAGRITMSQGDMSVGLELMLEGINMYEQTHQVVHPEVAAAYNNYAVTMNQLVRLRTSQLAAEGKEDADPNAGLDVATAIKLQRQAVMTAERTLGLHHSETIVYYFNLAMLEVVSGDQTIALRLFKHVLHLWDVVYGQEHPELTAILIHISIILQNQNRHAVSIVVLEEVHRIATAMFGSTHMMAGTAQSQLTQAHFLNGDIKKAADCAKLASEIYTTRLGPEDAQAKDAAKNYEILSGAVEQSAKQQEAAKKHLEQLRALQQARQTGPATAGKGSAVPNTAAAQAALAAAAAAAGQQIPGLDGQTPLGEADVDALVRYVQGQTKDTSSSKTRGKNAMRGKKRTGAKR